MTDRELLELAAKATGYDKTMDVIAVCDESGKWNQYVKSREWVSGREWNTYWNPLTDDGDSRRLQVALLIDLRFGVSDNFGPYVHARTEVRRGDFIDFHECYQWVSLHPSGDAAVRRAVLEVAAAIGKAMK